MYEKKCFQKILIFLLLAVLLSGSCCALSEHVILGGEVVGIQLASEGPVVVEVEKGSPAAEAGLKVGDMIVSYNQTPTHSTAQLGKMLLRGKSCKLGVLRNGKRAEYYLTPAQLASGGRIGVRVRDSISGIGTVTFIDPENGAFGALGHGVIDNASGKLLPIYSGFMVSAGVAEVKPGSRGNPGQLMGSYDVSRKIGTVSKNTQAGIFGVMQCQKQQLVPVGSASGVHPGNAEIYCTVKGNAPKGYSAEILRLDEKADNGRNLMLRVTDPELLAITGGIVQGMSGSPILQDGKLIGAVTHVLVNDPQKGYGILLDTMRNSAA